MDILVGSMGLVYLPTFTIKINHSCRCIYYTWILWDIKNGNKYTLRIQICRWKGISPIFLFWGWDWDHQSYSREGSGLIRDIPYHPWEFYIYLHEWLIFMVTLIVGKYTSLMDAMGMKKWTSLDICDFYLRFSKFQQYLKWWTNHWKPKCPVGAPVRSVATKSVLSRLKSSMLSNFCGHIILRRTHISRRSDHTGCRMNITIKHNHTYKHMFQENRFNNIKSVHLPPIFGVKIPNIFDLPPSSLVPYYAFAPENDLSLFCPLAVCFGVPGVQIARPA